MKYLTKVNDQGFQVTVEGDGRVIVDGQTFSVDLEPIDAQALFSLLIDHESYELVVDGQQDNYRVLLLGEMYDVAVEEDRPRRTGAKKPHPGLSLGGKPFDTPLATQGECVVRAPMSGLVVQVPVSVGQKVPAGKVLVILESMKMENELLAPRQGVVKAVHVSVGDTPSLDEPLVTLG